MRINNQDVKMFNFPDYQPHVDLNKLNLKDISEAEVTCSLTTSNDIIRLLLVNDVLVRNGIKVNLKIGYLLGARMDRAIDAHQPFTMKVIADILNTAKFNSIKIFNAHSEVCLSLLNAENILPFKQIEMVKQVLPNVVIVAPDKGAVKWLSNMFDSTDYVICNKTRVANTGKITEVEVLEPNKVKGKDCLIVDDICDGGKTIIEISQKLKKIGANNINLYVSHGIFSNGYNLENIDKIFTTNTYREKNEYPPEITVFDAF
jgi:ribose-phosphate pyrophosphokinase